jgi:hypothetical protein
MRRVFKIRYFARWMRKTELSDEALCSAVVEMAQGLIDADLGGGMVKKRVGVSGRGNIADDELEALKELAEQLLARTGKQLTEALNDGTLSEICHDH